MAEKEKKQPKEQQKKVDEQPKEEKVDNVPEQPKEEQKKVDKKQEQEQPKEEKEDFVAIIKELKDTQAKQVAEMQASYDAKLKERDEIIKQLIKGEQATNEGTSDVADLVNKNRNYKKW